MEVPHEAIYAMPVVAMFLGDVIKRTPLRSWVIQTNMLVGGLVTCLLSEWSTMGFVLGMELGAGGSGLQGLRKQVAKKMPKRPSTQVDTE